MARRNHLDDFTRRRMIRKQEEGRTDTSVAADFGINKSVVSRAWKAFQTTGTAVRKVGGGRLRTTTADNDQYIILQAKRHLHELASAIAQQLYTATGDKCRGLLWPDASTKGAYSPAVLNAASRLKMATDATIYSGAESTTTGQLIYGVMSSLRMRVGSVPEAILNAFRFEDRSGPGFIPLTSRKGTVTVVLEFLIGEALC
ncbi:uncharacterized protein TNCV_4048601 [Trichonephila clavipes]|nr:uncharacterized protein TNCV_4048601 [Trichonephila clavipes]